MATIGPYVLLIAVIVVFCMGLVAAAAQSFRYDLMATGRLLLGIIVLIAVLALSVFYFTYVLGVPSPLPDRNIPAMEP
jgi:hypothetical protein